MFQLSPPPLPLPVSCMYKHLHIVLFFLFLYLRLNNYFHCVLYVLCRMRLFSPESAGGSGRLPNPRDRAATNISLNQAQIRTRWAKSTMGTVDKLKVSFKVPSQASIFICSLAFPGARYFSDSCQKTNAITHRSFTQAWLLTVNHGPASLVWYAFLVAFGEKKRQCTISSELKINSAFHHNSDGDGWVGKALFTLAQSHCSTRLSHSWVPIVEWRKDLTQKGREGGAMHDMHRYTAYSCNPSKNNMKALRLLLFSSMTILAWQTPDPSVYCHKKTLNGSNSSLSYQA